MQTPFRPGLAVLLLPFALGLAACKEESPATTAAAEEVEDNDLCGARPLQGLVGQDRKVLETMRFGQTTRVIEPGSMVTMDYRADRLNIWITTGAKIEKVTCG